MCTSLNILALALNHCITLVYQIAGPLRVLIFHIFAHPPLAYYLPSKTSNPLGSQSKQMKIPSPRFKSVVRRF